MSRCRYSDSSGSGATASSGFDFIVAAVDSTQAWKDRADYVGDGVDDTVAIQAAIDALLDTGGQVKLAPGKFVTGSALILTTGVYLRGSGMSTNVVPGTRISLADGANSDMIEFKAGTNGFFSGISDIALNGNKANQTAMPHGAVYITENFSDTTMERLFIYDTWGDGIHGQSTWNIFLHDLWIEQIGNYYLADDTDWAAGSLTGTGSAAANGMFFNGCREFYCDNLYLFAIAQHGLHMTGCFKGGWSNLIFDELGVDGIFLSRNSGNSDCKLMSFSNVVLKNASWNAPNVGSYLKIEFADATADYINFSNLWAGRYTDTQGGDFSGNPVPNSAIFMRGFGSFLGDRIDEINFTNCTFTDGALFQEAGTNANGRMFESHTDSWIDVPAAVADKIVTSVDITNTSLTIVDQPDMPRTLKFTITDGDASISAYTITVTGVNGHGGATIETLTFADGLTPESKYAYATVSSIVVTDLVGNVAGDTVVVGTANKLGLSNVITRIGYGYKYTLNGVDTTIPTIDTTYSTIDVSGNAPDASKDYTINYRSMR